MAVIGAITSVKLYMMHYRTAPFSGTIQILIGKEEEILTITLIIFRDCSFSSATTVYNGTAHDLQYWGKRHVIFDYVSPILRGLIK